MKSLNNYSNKSTSLFKAVLFEQRLPWKYQNILLNHPNIFIRYKNIDGIKIRYRNKTTDEYIISEIFYSNEYPFDKLKINKNSNIIDIGAQIGCFALKISQIVKTGNIYCFEPMKWNYKLLKKNIKTNKLKNVKSYKMGVSSEDSEILYINFKNTGGHNIYTNKADLYFKIKTISLENFFIKENVNYLDLLKLDCEGAEYKILLNTPDNILKKINQIVLEYHNLDNNNYNISNLKIFLVRTGFKVDYFNKHENHKSTGTILFTR